MSYRMKKKPESMRVRKEPKKVEYLTCGECALGEWILENRNYKGETFIGFCEHSRWAKAKDGRGVFLDNSKACEFFKAGMKRNGGIS